MKLSLGGRELPFDVREWSATDRLAAGTTLATAAAALALLALLVDLLAPSLSGWALPLLIGGAVLVTAFHAAVDLVGVARARREAEEEAPEERLPTITLRCVECNTAFDLEDPGFRPLHHICPGCGVHGILERDAPEGLEVVAPPETGGPTRPPLTFPREAAPLHAGERLPPPPAPLEPPIPPASTPPKRRKFKFTCKGCGTASVVEDTGERPFVHVCAACGRAAKLNLPG